MKTGEPWSILWHSSTPLYSKEESSDHSDGVFLINSTIRILRPLSCTSKDILMRSWQNYLLINNKILLTLIGSNWSIWLVKLNMVVELPMMKIRDLSLITVLFIWKKLFSYLILMWLLKFQSKEEREEKLKRRLDMKYQEIQKNAILNNSLNISNN